MRIGTLGMSGLGLDPSDSCYDADRAWYVPNFWIDDKECACIAAEGRPLGEQCASFRGVLSTMGSQARDVGQGTGEFLGGVTGGAGAIAGGVVGGASSGIGGGLLQSSNLPGILLLAGVAAAAIFLMRR